MQIVRDRKKKEISNKSYRNNTTLLKKTLFGVDITDASQENILEYIINSLQNSQKNYYIVTPNPEMIVAARNNPEFRKVLNNAEIALNDGIGLSIGTQMLGEQLKSRFTGVDLVKRLCERLNDWPITVGFLGGRPGVAEKAVDCLVSKYPNLKIGFIGNEWPDDFSNKKEVSSIKYQVSSKESQGRKILNTKYLIHNTSSIDILFVAFGFPKQELWMANHLGEIPVRIMVGVGGAFDYISGNVPRAPKLLQDIGLEWLFRLIVQPWRIKRQLALGEFVWLVARKKFFKK